ncbi:tetratricopeptide repeat protein [Glaciecola sp. MH2013]|uniref:tetratricopeptide repeat protein n=1 Tax=Glaciecola sp. MH2013 TaxID=2785524 RepID=UPI00189F8E9F|nr:tetratricopeptide repeat protein [Glaciecola sp. MH2013]MBF7072445.1 tetratricopeptide repeat protein [Glaciecola sp. MH2013]
MKKQFKNLKTSVVISSILLLGSYSSASFAQANLQVQCPGYKPAKTQLLSEKTGKKLNKAFEAYNQDLVKEAIDLLYEIEAKDPFDRASVDRFLGQLLVSDEDRRSEAKDYIERAVKVKVLNDNDHAPLLKLMGDLEYAEGNYAKAIEWFERWMDFTCQEDGVAYLKIARSFSEMKKQAEVIAPADKAIELMEKPNQGAYSLKVQSYYERKMYAEAIDVLETAVQVFPDSDVWYTRLGLFYQIVESYDKALAMFELAYKMGHLKTASQYRSLAQLHAVNGAPYKSAKIVEKYLNDGVIPRTDTNLEGIANSYYQAREFKDAAKYFALAAVEGNDNDLYRRQGAMLLSAGDYKGAIQALNKALVNNEDNLGKVHYALIEAHFYSGDLRAAMKATQEAKKFRAMRKNALAWEPHIRNKASNKGINI